MIGRLLLMGMTVAGLAACATAQTADGVHAMTAAEISAAMKSAGPGATTALLPTETGVTALAVRRDQTGEVELHERVSDLLIIRQGTTRLLVGGRIEGGRQISPGEWRGGRIVGGHTVVMGTGDAVWMPPNVPHQMQVDPGKTLDYLAMKYPAANAR